MKKVTIFALCGLFHTACSTAEKANPAVNENPLNWGNIIMGIFVLGFFYVAYHAITIGTAWAKMRLLGTPTDSLSDAATDLAGTKTGSSASALDKTKAVEEKYSILKKLDLPIKGVGILATFLLFYGVATGNWVLFKGVGGFGPATKEMLTGQKTSYTTVKRNARFILDSTRLANNNAAWAVREANRHEEKMAKEARRMKQVEKSGSNSSKPWYVTTPKKPAPNKTAEESQDYYREMEASAGSGSQPGSNSSRRNIIPSRLAR